MMILLLGFCITIIRLFKWDGVFDRLRDKNLTMKLSSRTNDKCKLFPNWPSVGSVFSPACSIQNLLKAGRSTHSTVEVGGHSQRIGSRDSRIYNGKALASITRLSLVQHEITADNEQTKNYNLSNTYLHEQYLHLKDKMNIYKIYVHII